LTNLLGREPEGDVVDIESHDLPFQMAMVVDETKALYAQPKGDICLRDNIVNVLDLADDLGCSALIICLDKRDVDLALTLHSLLYVGGTVIDPTKVHYDSQRYLLVGMEV